MTAAYQTVEEGAVEGFQQVSDRAEEALRERMNAAEGTGEHLAQKAESFKDRFTSES